jgi:hypothetical protein
MAFSLMTDLPYPGFAPVCPWCLGPVFTHPTAGEACVKPDCKGSHGWHYDFRTDRMEANEDAEEMPGPWEARNICPDNGLPCPCLEAVLTCPKGKS